MASVAVVTGVDGTTIQDGTTTVAATDNIRNGLVSLIVVITFAAAVVLNAGFVALFVAKRELRSPTVYLLISIAVADALSAVFWILPSAVAAASWSWILGAAFCQVQGFASTLFYAVNAFTLLAVALERFVRFWSPSRHKLAFTRTITAILVSALWLMSATFAVVPLLGWADYGYIRPRFGCLMNFGLSYSLLDFYTVAGYGLPTLIGAVCFLLILGKVVALRGRTDAAGRAILEERTDRIGESYGQKFRRQEDRYRNVASKSDKPTFRKSSDNEADPGGQRRSPMADPDSDYDLSDDFESDDEDYYTDYVEVIKRRREKEQRLRQTRKYRLHRRDVSMTLTVFIVWAIYVALWLPYVVLNYIWILDNYPDFGDQTAHTAFMIVALISTAYKPLIYLSNSRIRSTLKTCFKKRRKERISG